MPKNFTNSFNYNRIQRRKLKFINSIKLQVLMIWCSQQNVHCARMRAREKKKQELLRMTICYSGEGTIWLRFYHLVVCVYSRFGVNGICGKCLDEHCSSGWLCSRSTKENMLLFALERNFARHLVKLRNVNMVSVFVAFLPFSGMGGGITHLVFHFLAQLQ